jgi:alpha-D-xyloside xylohydrolase
LVGLRVAALGWYDYGCGQAPANQPMAASALPRRRRRRSSRLFVRAGSIIPLGPDLQSANEKPADPIELRIYRGADGHFTIYEDEGDSSL